MMKLYNNAQSRGMTLLPLLKELGIEDQIEQIEMPYENMHQTEYTSINPMGKVPCLVDQGVVITEVAAIFTYLADKYMEKGLAPALDDPKRGAYLKWMFFAISFKILPYLDEFKPFIQLLAQRDSMQDVPWFQKINA